MKLVEGVLDPKHPQISDALGEYKDSVDMVCVTDERSDNAYIVRLEQAASVYPDGIRGKFRDRQVMRYLAATIAPKDRVANGTGVFFLPGVFGTAPGALHIVASLYDKVSQRFDEPVGLGVSFSSSFSQDSVDHPLHTKPSERATYQAVFMAELLHEYQLSRVWLTGHSNGGLESMYVLPALKKLIQEDGLNTQVDGLILIQSAGLYKQNPIAFIRRYRAKPLIDEAARYVYPDEVDYTEMEILRRRISRTLVGADLRGGEVPRRAYSQVGRAFFEQVSQISDKLRSLIAVPVGMMWGRNDSYFPAQDALKRIDQTSMFPNAPVIGTIISPNWPHLGLAVNTNHFSRMALDLMESIKKPHSEFSQDPLRQAQIQLSYS